MSIRKNYCSSCGAKVRKDNEICPSCGKPFDDEMLYGNTRRIGAGGVGYSEITDHESFKAYKKITGKIWAISIPVITIIVILASMFTGAGLTVGLLAGIVVFIIMLIVGLMIGRKKPVWEGTVVRKSYHRRRKDDGADDETYTIFFRTDSGKKKSQVWRSHSSIYDYLKEGDRVRFLGNLGSQNAFEKYDKSEDDRIPCAACGTMMDPRYDYCTVCGCILLKGETET